MNLTLHVWRQKDASTRGQFVTYQATDISPDTSFLEMLDVVNEELTATGGQPSTPGWRSRSSAGRRGP